MNGIGIVVALPREIPAGFVRIDKRQGAESWALAVYRSASAAAPHVAVQAGVGNTRAAEGARLLIRRFSPEALVSVGFAGGLLPSLNRGTLIIGTEVVCEDLSPPWATAARDLVEQFQAAADAEALPAQQGRLVTSHHMVADPASKAALRGKSGACAVDMETMGIAGVAHEAGLPWAAVRVIVDSARDTLPPALLTALREDGHVATGRLLQMLCRSPQLLCHLLWLLAATATARRHLSQIFARWTTRLGVQRQHEPG